MRKVRGIDSMSASGSKDCIGLILNELRKDIKKLDEEVMSTGITLPNDDNPLKEYREGYKDALLDVQEMIKRKL